MELLLEHDWHARQEKHRIRVRRWIEPRLSRASRNEKDPVEDFLFDYYANRPGRLLRWHPGIGVALLGKAARLYLCYRDYHEVREGITVNVDQLSPQRLESIRWLQEMLGRTMQRAGVSNCFGLHEWAMIYTTGDIRHADWPLRVTRAEIANLVESLGPRCTHYDAFRFFAPDARPLNKYQPTRETTITLEQPACLHANMDLYKWAFKLSPFTASELIADCFDLARELRVLDMRASPYDFTALGHRPIPIETPEGRAEYEALQRQFAVRAAPLRERLVLSCEQVLAQACLPKSRCNQSVPPNVVAA